MKELFQILVKLQLPIEITIISFLTYRKPCRKHDLKGFNDMITVKIFRGTGISNGYYDHYELQLPSDDTWSVLDVLDYIYENLDSSLSYYRHSTCNQGVCGRCAVKINGKNGLACVTKVLNEDLTIEPKNSKVLKDLVTE